MNHDSNDATVVDLLVNLAGQVRLRLGTTPVEGQCRQVCLATALALIESDQPVCVSSGKVIVNQEEHGHFWLRFGNTIIDPTADQFGISPNILVKSEGDMTSPTYQESNYIIIRARRVLSLAGLLPAGGSDRGAPYARH